MLTCVKSAPDLLFCLFYLLSGSAFTLKVRPTSLTSAASGHLTELHLLGWGSQPGISRGVPSSDRFFLSQPQDQITITGYEKNTEAARDAILKIVGELEQMVSEDVPLDHRVHARIIGARGKAIRKIMDEFKVGPQPSREGAS